MYVQYRLFSERSLWRTVEISRSENYILANDLKNIICKQSNINYNNKIEIYFSVYREEDEGEAVDDEENHGHGDGGDGRGGGANTGVTAEGYGANGYTLGKRKKEMKYLSGDDKIYSGTKLLVHRDVKKKNNNLDITHKAKKEIILNVEEKQKINVPNEFLCKLCNFLLIESHIIVCTKNCGYSVCKCCILFYIFNSLIVENERRNNFIDVNLLSKKDSIKCPICKGILKYCMFNKKMEMTLKRLHDERKDIDSVNLLIKERNNKFMKIIERLKIENFDWSCCDVSNGVDDPIMNNRNEGNLFECDVFKTIENKFILTNTGGKINQTEIADDNRLYNHFLYLMESNKLGCIKEYNLIFIDFDSCIFDIIQKMSVKCAYAEVSTVGEVQEEMYNGEEVEKRDLLDASEKYTVDNDEKLDVYRSNQKGNVEGRYEGENSSDEIDEELYNKNKVYIMPISFVGGETSYSLIGVFYIKGVFTRIGNGGEEKELLMENFLRKWFLNENKKIENILDMLNFGNIYTVDYVKKYERTCFFPARKQPIYNIINTRRQKAKRKNNIEIVLEFKRFGDVLLSVHNYIKYGSRPNNYEGKRGGAPTVDDVPEQVPHTSFIGTSTATLASALPNCLTRRGEFQEVYNTLYDTKAVPVLCAQDKFNVSNPYVGYCALLPFLTKEDFLLFRKLQRIYKEKYLRKLYRHIRENGLNMNIFFNAVNAVFFSTTRGAGPVIQQSDCQPSSLHMAAEDMYLRKRAG
ncbi:conserved Plasmodium protein, unknown function [Plasmodium ovale]|uniref:RING-type domain-containing protein n=1 Tax=Plasmodium ovale TaxID=36330 RepID=A0A1D3KWV4_PLAOA|nr:conserved Plasmodium protein, unknown function [Plasmodium ovale]